MSTLLVSNELPEKGYEDIYSPEPYMDAEEDGNRYLVHMMYVPPNQRAGGLGQKLFKDFLSALPAHIQYIRLKSCSLGSGDSLPFWTSLGFRPAYDCTCDDNLRILHLPVNGFSAVPIEKVENEEERHYIFD